MIATLRLLCLIALSALGGCFSFSTIHTARPIKTGTNDLVFAPVAIGVFVQDQQTTTVTDTFGSETETKDNGGLAPALVLPSGEIQYRHGFGPRFDFGVKLFALGIGMDFNMLVVDTQQLAMSVDPTFTASRWFTGVGDGYVGTVWLPLLFDVVTTRTATVTLGAKPGALIIGGADDAEDSPYDSKNTLMFLLGGMAGVKIRFTKQFYMMPEVNALWDFQTESLWWNAVLAFGFNG